MQRSALWLLVAAGGLVAVAARAASLADDQPTRDRLSAAAIGLPFIVGPTGEPSSVSSSPAGFVSAGGRVYFTASTASSGREVWRTDCTEEGTALITDIYPGESPTSRFGPFPLTAIDDAVFFNPIFTTAIWRTAGTPESTFPVTGTGTGFEPIVEFDNKALLFGIRNNSNDSLWRSDGTVEGTFALTQSLKLRQGITQRLLVVGEAAYFEDFHYQDGGTLWKTDGTRFGTSAIAVPFPRDPAARVVPLGVLERLVFFAATPTSGRSQLWVYDEALHRSRVVRLGFVSIAAATTVGDALLFAADDGEHGMELWRTDGTTEGTYLVSDLVTGPPGSSLDWEANRLGRVVGDVLLFGATGPDRTRILWRSDGTEAGTAPLDDSPGAPVPHSFGPIVDDQLYVFASDEASGPELWIATPAAMNLVRDIHAGRSGSNVLFATVLGSTLYFVADSDGVNGSELWLSDGSTDGTLPVADIKLSSGVRPPPIAACADGFAFAFENEVGFTDFGAFSEIRRANLAADFTSPLPTIMSDAGDALAFRYGNAVWLTDGSQAGTRPLGIDATEAVAWNDRIYLNGSATETGIELWEATVDGALTLVRDINPVPNASSAPKLLTSSRDGVFFSADDGEQGRELWFSDGTETGTHLVHKLRRGLETNPMLITSLDNTVYFVAAPLGELWLSDGTVSGTQRLALSTTIGNPTGFTAFKGSLFFGASGGWFSHAPGAALVRIADATPRSVRAVDDALYFGGFSSDAELWRSDGTPTGASLVKDINAESSSSPSGFVRVGDYVLFSANDGIHGHELWRTDGTPSGTALVRDLYEGRVSSSPTDIVALGDQAVFTAFSAKGSELWQSDGTAAGTRLLADLIPGAASSSPRQLTRSGSHLFFTAFDTTSTRQLWAIPFTIEQPCAGDCDGSDDVTVDELVLLTIIALGDADVGECGAGDSDGDASISVDEIVAATLAAIDGCAG